jgi:hypothetical protein
VWVEAPSPEEILMLESASGCVAETCAVSPALLEVALIKWLARHGEARAAAWKETAGGFKVPMPVVRRFPGGTLRLVEGAASVMALRDARPASDGAFPALVLLS